jgi:hypoxanthine phosphoribosyltransferase
MRPSFQGVFHYPRRLLAPLITAERIRERVAMLASDIHRDYPDGVHLVGVLKGSFVFLADLIRALPVPSTVDFLATTSYGSRTSSSGQVRILKDLEDDIRGRDVLIVEDIIDSGQTLAYLLESLRARQPRRVGTVCLLNKTAKRVAPVQVDYLGFTIDDVFVVGYGLDNSEAFRNLPYIAVAPPPRN